MSHDRDIDLLVDRLVYARLARKFYDGVTWEQFREDIKLQSAVQHALQIVGEAAFKVSKQQEAMPGVPWPRIIGLRHRLVHDYPRIELPKPWTTVQQHVGP
jgi:uncharacterized protein with HEPN domain